MIGLSLLGLILAILIGTVLFVNLSPQFGKSPTKEQKETYAKTGHYKQGKFVNNTRTEMDVHIWPTLKKMLNPQAERTPNVNIPVDKIDSLEIVNHEPITCTHVGRQTIF